MYICIMDKNNFEILNTFLTKNGITIWEVENVDEFSYPLLREYSYIKDLFPEFDCENKNGKFLICENKYNIY